MSFEGLFPTLQATKIDEDAENEKRKIDEETQRKISELPSENDGDGNEDSGNEKAENGDGKDGKKKYSPLQISAIVGIVVGSILSLGVLFIEVKSIDLAALSTQGFDIAVLLWKLLPVVIVWAAGFAICVGGYVLSGKLKERSSEKRAEQRAETEHNIKADAETAKQAAMQRAANEKQAYAASFEQAVRDRSRSLVKSELVKEVIGILMEDIRHEIDEYDRSSYIDAISIDYRIAVFADRIESNASPYLFRERRCAALSQLDQAAVARCIEAGLRMNMEMVYKKDPSGSPAETNISHSYTENKQPVQQPVSAEGEESKPQFVSEWSADVIMSYRAQNANYKAERAW